MEKVAIAIVGPICSGKGTAVEYLKAQGFKSCSLSDRIREVLNAVGSDTGRVSMQNMGDRLRKNWGLEVLAKRTADICKDKGVPRVVIESIRHPKEVEYLKTSLDTVTIGLTADRNLRWLRCLERKREGDPKSWEEFLAVDEREFRGGGDGQIDIGGCMNLADNIIQNEEGKENLFRELKETLERRRILLEGSNPKKETFRFF
jgi:dephospho-CoA kinase